MLRRRCKTCKHYRVRLSEEPCRTCYADLEAHPFRAGRRIKWEPRENYHQPKHDKVGERLRGDQRKGRPYRRSKADLKEAVNRDPV